MKAKKFEIIGYTKIEVKTIIQAKSENEAIKKAIDRDLQICIHGTDNLYAEHNWVYIDAPNVVEPNLITQY